MIDGTGPAGGPLVIAVHGAVANRVTMRPLAHALPAGVRVLAPDLPGHGARTDSLFTFEQALSDLEALVDGAGDVPVVLVGDSLGGYLVLALAARTHRRLAGVVAGGCTFDMRGVRGWPARASDMNMQFMVALGGERRITQLLLAGFGILARDPELRADVAAAGMNVHARGRSLDALATFDLPGTVRAIKAPVTFVNGARDFPIVWGTRRYAGLAATGRAIVIPGVGHGVATLRPEPVAAEVLRFLGRVFNTGD